MGNPGGIELFCIGGNQDGRYVRVSEYVFLSGYVEFAQKDKEPGPTFRVETYLVQQFLINDRRLVFLVAEDVSLNAETTQRIIRHLVAMATASAKARMDKADADKADIRRSFWTRHTIGYMELVILAKQIGGNSVVFEERAIECYARAHTASGAPEDPTEESPPDDPP